MKNNIFITVIEEHSIPRIPNYIIYITSSMTGKSIKTHAPRVYAERSRLSRQMCYANLFHPCDMCMTADAELKRII